MPMSSADQRVNDLGRPSYPTLWPSELNHNVSVSLHCVHTSFQQIILNNKPYLYLRCLNSNWRFFRFDCPLKTMYPTVYKI